MSLSSQRQFYSVRKTLERLKSAYRYEVQQDKQKFQLYNIFLKDKQDLFLLYQAINLIKVFTSDTYLQIKHYQCFDKDQTADTYNLHILTEFQKISLKSYLHTRQDRSTLLSYREVALLLKSFVQFLYDIVSCSNSSQFLQYLEATWDNEVLDIFYLNDNFQVKINLLPNFNKLTSVNWTALNNKETLDIGSTIKKIIFNFIAKLCPSLPVKEDSPDLPQGLEVLSEDSDQYWDRSFNLPHNLIKTIFDLLTIGKNNYIHIIKQLHRLTTFEGYSRHLHYAPVLKYNYDIKYSRSEVMINNDFALFKFINDIGLERIMQRECPEIIGAPKSQIETRFIEALTICSVDLSPSFFQEINTKDFPALRKLRLKNCGIRGSLLIEVLKLNIIASLDTLDLSGTEENRDELGYADCRQLFSNSKLSNLKELILACCALDDLSLIYLCGSPHLAELETLDLSFNERIHNGFSTLNKSEHLNNLKCLKLRSHRLQDDGLLALLESNPPYKTYKELDLRDCGLTSSCVRIIAESRLTQSLETLYLDLNNLSGLVNYRAKDKIPTLRKISAQRCKMNDNALEGLLSLSVAENLIYLDVSLNSDLGMYLSNAHKMRGLKQLLLEGTHVDQKFFEKLVDKGVPHGLEKLCLKKGSHYSTNFESILKKGTFPSLTEVVADQMSTFQLNVLFIYFPLAETASGLEVLSASPAIYDQIYLKDSFQRSLYMTNLCELKIENAGKGSHLMIELSKSDTLGKLRVLEMPLCSIQDRAIRVLCKRGRLGSLKRLNLSGHTLGYKTMKYLILSRLGLQLDYLDVSLGKKKAIKWTKKLRGYKRIYRKDMILNI